MPQYNIISVRHGTEVWGNLRLGLVFEQPPGSVIFGCEDLYDRKILRLENPTLAEDARVCR